VFLSNGEPVIFAVDGLADLNPTIANQTYYASTSLSLSGLYATYSAIYRAQLWPYAIVTKLARAVARLPFELFRLEDNAERTRLTPQDSRFADLMARPNSRMSPFLLWLWTESVCEIYGEAIWLKLRDDRGRVRELWPIHPANMLVTRNPDGETVYLYTAGGLRAAPMIPPIPESEVIHFRGFNPDNTSRGMSPLEPLRQTLLAEDASRRASASMWRNGARPSVALVHPSTLNENAIKRLKASWDDMHSGVDNWAKTAILEEGMEPKVLQLSAEEMQYIESRKLNREECCAAYDMPPPAVHILDRATFSNITEQFRSVYRDVVPPRLIGFQEQLAHSLAPDFSDEGPVVGAFRLEEILRGDWETRATAMAQAIGTGQLMPSEARAMDNRPYVEGSDRLLVNAALIPLSVEAGAAPTGVDLLPGHQTVKTPELEAAPPPTLEAAALRKVLRRLDAAPTLETVAEPALVAGLSDADAEHVRSLLRAARLRDAGLGELRTWLSATAANEGIEDLCPV
jgi:HK97 family phage portal protein